LPTRDTLPHIPLEYIIDQTIKTAPIHKDIIEEYTANMYTKGRINIKKSNILINYIPSMFKLKKGVREYITESYSELHYTPPDIYDRKIRAYHGTIDKIKNFNESILDYFDVSIYANSAFDVKLTSPISSNAKKYYNYQLDSIRYDENGRYLYYISFIPRLNSFQLIEGYMAICDNTWIIRELKFSGRSEYLNYTNILQMGNDNYEHEKLLPIQFDSRMSFHLLGNVIDGYFTINMDYKSIKKPEKDIIVKNRKSKYDLTKSFTLRSDTSAYIKTDSNYFAKLRPIPLNEDEKNIYKRYYEDKEKSKKKLDTNEYKIKDKKNIFWWNVGDFLISSYSVNSSQQKVRFSPLINPFLISYSGSDGFSYRQNVRYQRIFRNNRNLNVSPMIGYNFNYQEFYWRIPVEFEYIPAGRGNFRLDIGNGNRIYSSDIMNELKEIPSNIIDFDSINIEYFRNFHVDLTHSIEVLNGLTIDAGISVHRRSAIDKPDIKKTEKTKAGDDNDYDDIIKNIYVSFAPRLKVSWTPGQYYYKIANKKINLSSKWPTFSFDYERGIKGVFNSSGKYERLEFDMQHAISLGLMHNIYYRAGAGKFTDQEQMYFVDFRNFAKNNLPTSWNDDIGGTFQILDRRWYNSSREYMRANFTYEAPFIIIPHIFKRVPNALNERLYFGILTMSHLNPYIELGYGIGTHIFDFGVFVSNKNGKFHNAGVKLTIELFNR
jgi:hypothetical protein